MPRGPGKKENYNLDYSRFGQLDDGAGSEDDDDDARIAALASKRSSAKIDGEADAAGGPSGPSMKDMVAGMPRDLQDAYRLMAIARVNNDPDAERDAMQLVLQGIEKGGPEVKASFLKNVGEQMPEVAEGLKKGKSLAELVDEQAQLKAAEKGKESFTSVKSSMKDADDLQANINAIKAEMEAGREATRKQMEALQQQSSQMEKLHEKGPEDIFKFMTESGMTHEDIQRIFTGDQAHMESCMKRMVDKVGTDPHDAGEADKAEKAVKAAEALHSSICGNGKVAEQTLAEADQPAAPAKPKVKKVVVPEEPKVTIPDHRLQYARDTDGRYTSVELKVSMPGVESMSAILLDVSEKYLRLNTTPPAPRYAVNAGPFPVLIDASAARAKFSKKREELSITVPAMP